MSEKAFLFWRRESLSGLKKCALDIRTESELKIEGGRRSHRSVLLSGSALTGRPWMANCRLVGASQKGSQGLMSTGKSWLSLWLSASKKGE